MLKFHILLLRKFSIFQKNLQHALHLLYTFLIITVEFDFTRSQIWFSSTFSPGFKNHAPILQISDVSDFM